MKDSGIPLKLLLPILLAVAVVTLLFGWFLGRSGWNISEVGAGPVKLVPPTASAVVLASPSEVVHATVMPSATISPKRIPETTSVIQLSSTPSPASQRTPLTTSLADRECDTRYVVADSAAEGTKKTYVRCPIGEVEYIIQPDDILVAIELECSDTARQPITFNKDAARSEGERLAVFTSAVFSSRRDCRVYITIANTVSDLMGYRVLQEVIRQP